MLSVTLHGIYLLTISLAALIGAISYKKILWEFKPLVCFLFSEMFFELCIFFVSKSIPVLEDWWVPLQALAGTALLCWLAVRWNLFGKKRAILFGCIAVSSIIGLSGIILQEETLSRWFSISADLVKVIIGIEAVHRALIAEMGSQSQKPMVLTGLGLLVFYTFSILLSAFIQLGNTNSQEFLQKVYLLYIPFGIIGNVLFIGAVVWLPRGRGRSFV